MKTLNIYGPGGPYSPMSECAEQFAGMNAIRVVITKGTPEQWIERARNDADMIYGGAEYMLDDFIAAYPGIVDPAAVINLHARAVGIIVKKGNPRNIRGLADLGLPAVKILNVELEKMEDLQNRVPGVREKIKFSVLTGEEGADKWLSSSSPDAWITYRSWHIKLKDHTEFVPLSGKDALSRWTPIGITKTSPQRGMGYEFISFLKSGQGHSIFRRWGWQ